MKKEKKMKKIIAILIVALMLGSLLAACSGSDNGGNAGDSGASNPPPAASPPASSGPSGGTTTLGWYPDAYEASLNREKYSIAYVTIAMSDQLHSAVNVALRDWAAVLNCDYVSFDAKGDSDSYLTAIETYAGQGLDGLILDDISAQTRSVEICEDHGTVWYPALSTFLNDDKTHYIAPGAILAGYDCGVAMTDWVFDNYASQLGIDEVDPSQIGFIYLDYSPHPDFHARIKGAADRYAQLYPNLVSTNWIPIDVLPGSPANTEGAFDLVSAHLSTNGGDFDVWAIGSSTDEFAIGAARAIEQLNMEDRCIITAIFGGSVIEEWNSGKQSVWKSSVTVPVVELTETMICGLLAVLDGRATYEDLHRDHVPPGENYGILNFEPRIYTYDNRGEYWATVADWIAHKYK